MKAPKAKKKTQTRKEWMILLDLANAQPRVQHRDPKLRTR